MKRFLVLVMIISLLTVAILGCSNGLVSSKEDLSGGDKPTQETKPTNPGQNEPEIGNSNVTDEQEQTEPETPEVVPPKIDQKEIEKPEAEKTEENQSEKETPEVIPPTVEQPEVVPPVIETPEVIQPEVKPPVDPPPVDPPVVVPPVDPPPVEPPEVETPETEPPIIEPPEIIPPIVPPNITMLLINELKTEYSYSAKRAEFIEFKILTAGNLNGISVHILNNASNPFVYNFPAVDVAKGEYVTLHLRTVDSNCKDELGDNLALSGGIDSCPTARDLWVAGSEKYLYKTDIVYIKDASGNILDAVVMNDKPSATWNNSQSHFQAITEFLCSVGAWESADGEKPTAYDAVDTSTVGSNYMRSVCRYEWRQNHFNTSDWYVSKTNYSPGLPND